MIRLVCIDVDGTLVGTSGEVHSGVWRAAEQARAAGILLAVCSGRPGFGVTREIAERIYPGGWHSFQNGASTINLQSGQSRSSRLAPEIVAMLIARARETERVLELYNDHDYVVERTDEVARAHAALLGLDFKPRPFEELIGPIVRAQWLVSAAEEAVVMAEPHDGLELSRAAVPSMPNTGFLNLTSAGVTKATSVRALSVEYDVPLEQVMFVGDAWNDIPAMRIVGYSVAMANAEPPVHAAALHRVGHVDEGGLAEALEFAVKGAVS